MAFVTPLPQEQQNQFSPQGQTTPNPMSMMPPQAGGSSGQGGAGGPSNAPSMGSSTQFGSSASRLGDYLQANKDQVQQMANQVAGQIGTNYNNVQQGVNQAGQNFANLVQSSYTPTDPSVLNQVKSNPTDAAKNPDTLKAFQSQLNSQYTGPSSFEGSTEYSGAQKNVQDAIQQAGLLGNYSGLSGYLQNNIEKNATPGQNTLDSVLLQSSQPAFQTVQDAAKPFAGLNDYLSGVSAQQNQGVQAAQAAAPAARQSAQQTLTDVATPFVSGLNTAYTQGTQKSTDYNNKLNTVADKVANGKFDSLTPEEQSLIGYNPALTNLISGYPTLLSQQAQDNPINFGQFFTQGQQAQVPTPANVVSPDQIAEWQALTQLGGNSPTGLNFDMPTAAQPLQGQTGSQPGVLPEYKNMQALQAIDSSYGNMYDQLVSNGFQGVPQQGVQRLEDYMNALRGAEGSAQPGSQPLTPPPPSGSAGDLGAGFHWDTNSGSWQPTIPLAPPGGQPTPGQPTVPLTSGGGGRAFR